MNRKKRCNNDNNEDNAMTTMDETKVNEINVEQYNRTVSHNFQEGNKIEMHEKWIKATKKKRKRKKKEYNTFDLIDNFWNKDEYL